MNRRTLLKGMAAAVTLGETRLHAANDRIQLGIIGVGMRGRSLSRLFHAIGQTRGLCRIVAVCDVYARRRREAAESFQCPAFLDHHELLSRSDIDAVVIAAPDHWHALMATAALEKGKDVYLEKPMSHTIYEARLILETVQRTRRVLQVGANGGSSNQFLKAKELLSQGAIGQLVMCQATEHRNSVKGEWNWDIAQDAGPDCKGDGHIDWQRFLGPAPKRPWQPDRFFNFRKWWDYSGGIATDLFYHSTAPFNMVWDKPLTPARVTASGGIYAFRDREVPDTFHMAAEYAAGFSVVLTGSMANASVDPASLRGREGTLMLPFDGNSLILRPEKRVITNQYKSRFGDADTTIAIEPTPRDAHLLDWLSCIRSRRQPRIDSMIGACAQVPISMAVMAYRKNKVLGFTPGSWKVTGV